MAQIADYTEKATTATTDEFILQETGGGVTKKMTQLTLLKDVNDDIANLEANPVMPSNYITNLEISTGSDPNTEIDIAVGRARNSDNDGDIILSAGVTVDITAAGLLGLDTGSVAADSIYYIWLIYHPVSDLESLMFSLSKTSPTLPAGYTKKRRIRGARLTDGSANIITMYQKGDYSWFDAAPMDLDITVAPNSRSLLTVSTPPNMIGIISLIAYDVNPRFYLIGNVNEIDVAPSATYCHAVTDDTGRACNLNKEILVDATSQIYWRLTATTYSWIKVVTAGFIDSAQD